MNELLILILGTIYLMGVIHFYLKTCYSDMNYTPSWESPFALIWFAWFPVKNIFLIIIDFFKSEDKKFKSWTGPKEPGLRK